MLPIMNTMQCIYITPFLGVLVLDRSRPVHLYSLGVYLSKEVEQQEGRKTSSSLSPILQIHRSDGYSAVALPAERHETRGGSESAPKMKKM